MVNRTGSCPCNQPHTLYPFPSENSDVHHRVKWIEALRLVNTSGNFAAAKFNYGRKVGMCNK